MDENDNLWLMLPILISSELGRDRFDNWIRNFENKDRDAATVVLSKMEFISEDDISLAIENRLQEIQEQYPNGKILLSPIGEPHKSGTRLNRNFPYSKYFEEFKKRFELAQSQSALEKHLANKPDIVLVFYDDFFGSGQTIENFFKQYVLNEKTKLKLKTHITANSTKIQALCFMAIKSLKLVTDSLENLKKELTEIPEIKLFVEFLDQAFDGDQPIFREQKEYFRDLCEYYGKIADPGDPLGFSNGQTLLTFSHGTPDNSLPIIWSSQNGWKPAFPRLGKDKIKASRINNQKLALEMAALRWSDEHPEIATGIQTLGWKTVKFISREDFLAYGIFRFLQTGKDVRDAVIQFKLTQSEIFHYIENLKKKKWIDDANDITEIGKEIIKTAATELSKLYDYRNKLISSEKEVRRVLPRTFKGVSRNAEG